MWCGNRVVEPPAGICMALRTTASTGITFRMDLPFKTAEKTSSKSEMSTEETASGGHAVSLSSSGAGEEQKALKEAETSSVQHVVKVLKAKNTPLCAACIEYTHYHPQLYFTYLQIIFKQLSVSQAIILGGLPPKWHPPPLEGQVIFSIAPDQNRSHLKSPFL